MMESVINCKLTSANFEREMMPTSQRLELQKMTVLIELVDVSLQFKTLTRQLQ